MTMPAFRVARPKTVDEAVRLLADHGSDAMIIAGGTDVIPNLQMRLFSPRLLVDLKPLGALSGIEFSPRDGLRIGAMTTLTQIFESPLVRDNFPVLSSAAGTIAGPAPAKHGNARWKPLSRNALPLV